MGGAADGEEVVDEVVEEMQDLKVDSSATASTTPSPKPRRRMPRRAVSTDGMSPPPGATRGGKRGVGRTRTGDGSSSGANSGLAPLRRTATDSGRLGRMGNQVKAAAAAAAAAEAGEGEGATTASPRKRGGTKPPGRSKSAEDSAPPTRTLPSRAKSGQIGPSRSAPKRTASGFGRAPPRRQKSSDGAAATSAFSSLRKGRKKEKAGSSEDTRNIFGSDLVSTAKILEDINECKESTAVIRLELEDFFMAEREDPEAIPLALKELLECDDRPWEGVQFLDDIMDGSIYEEFRERKKHFLRTMAGVCEARLIPVTYKAKITLSSGSLDMEEMCDMLFYLRSDKAVTDLTLKSEQVDEGIIRALVELFKADKRKWKSVTLQLSGTGPGKPGSAEHNTWAKEMQAATEEMQKVCKDRGINLG